MSSFMVFINYVSSGQQNLEGIVLEVFLLYFYIEKRYR